VHVHQCINILPVLTRLREIFSSTLWPLATVSVNLEPDEAKPDETIEGLEKFLQVCPSLRCLGIDVDRHRLINLEVLARHGPTLSSLALGTGQAERNRVYPPSGMKTLLDVCNKLKYLQINLPDPKLKLGHIEHLADDFVLGPKLNDLTLMLVSANFRGRKCIML